MLMTALALVFIAQSTISVPPSGMVWTDTNLPAKISVSLGQTSVGTNACPNATSSANTCVGDGAGKDITSGNYNTLGGLQAGWRMTTANQNALYGSYAGRFVTTGGALAIFGHAACATITTANYNTCIGAFAFTNAINSQYTTGVGYGVGYYTTYGYSNSVVGHHGLFMNTTGSHNNGLGQAALYLNFNGHRNIAIGYDAGSWGSDAPTGHISSGSSNLGVGQYNYRVAMVLDGEATGMGYVFTTYTDASHREITLDTLPTYTGPQACASRLVYRSTAGDVNQTTYKLAATIGDCTTVGPFIDSVSDASLGAIPTDPSDSIAIGHEAKYTKSGQTVIGSTSTNEAIVYGAPIFPALAGSDAAYACLDAQGKLYRSVAACR